MSHLDQVKKLFEQAALAKIGSGYAAVWGNMAETAESLCLGNVSHALDALPVTEHTFFDLASLTKILATTSLIMVLTEEGRLDLEAPLSVYLPQETKNHPHLAELTLKQLLSHTSGLPAWNPYYEQLKIKFGENIAYVSVEQRKAYFYSLILATPLSAAPGEKMEYSDVGISVLGYMLEKLYPHSTLSQLVRDRVWSKILAKGHPITLHYRPVHCGSAAALDPKMVATEICPWRGWLQGQVHDDNAWSMGGVAAHAGVFGTISDIQAWICALLDGKIVSYRTLRQFFSEVNFTSGLNKGVGSRRTSGFDQPSLDGSGTTGFAFSPYSVGHLGFSGTSVWMDLDSGDYACLLTNRVHPARNDLRIKPLRTNFHTIIRSVP